MAYVRTPDCSYSSLAGGDCLCEAAGAQKLLLRPKKVKCQLSWTAQPQQIKVAPANPHDADEDEHGSKHKHGTTCGHVSVQHGSHFDYLMMDKAGGLELCHEDEGQHAHHSLARATRGWNLFELGPQQLIGRNLSPEAPAQQADAAEPLLSKKAEVAIDMGLEAVGRTTLYVSGICCSSEVPIIEKLLMPLPGVSRVRTNVMTRTAYVDHLPGVTPGSALVSVPLL
jgi:copper chaperone CopZ